MHFQGELNHQPIVSLGGQLQAMLPGLTCVAAKKISSSARRNVAASCGLAIGASSSASIVTSSRSVTHVTSEGTCADTTQHHRNRHQQ